MRKIRDHQLDSPRLSTVEQGLATLQSEIVEARGDQFASLRERLDHIAANIGGGGGGGSGGGLVGYEEISPQPGSAALVLAQPYQIGREKLLLYYNGVLLTPGTDNDYTEVDGRTINLNFATRDGDRFTALVMANPQGEVHWFRQQVIGQDGQTDFTLARPYQMGVNGIQVYKNGILQTEGADNDYIEVDDRTIRMTVPASSADVYLFLIPISRSIVNWWRRQVITTADMPSDVEVGRVYVAGSNQLQVYRNGILQMLGHDYIELNSNTVRFLVQFEDEEVIQFILPESGPGQQIGVLQDQVNDLRDRVVAAEQTVSGYEQALGDLEEMKQQVARFETDLASLNDSVAQKQQETDAALADHENQLADIQGRVEALEAQAGALQADLETLESEVSNLGSRAESLETELASLATQATNLETGLTDLTTRVTTLETDVTQLHAIVAADLPAALDQTSALADEIADARGPFSTLSDRLDYIMQNAGGNGGGGGGAGLISYEEILTPAGLTELMLTKPYKVGQRVILYRNGLLLTAGPGADFEETDGTQLLLHFVTGENDRFVVMIMGEDGGSSGPGVGGGSLIACDEIVPAAGIKSFILPTPYTPGEQCLFLYYNGLLLMPGADKDYTTDGTTVTLNFEVEADDRFVAIVMGYGSGGGGAPGWLANAVLELQTKLSKSDFKLEVLRRAYAYYCNEACDVFTDDTGIDQNASTGINYDPNAQVVTSEHGGELVTVEIPTSVSPSQVLLLWEGMNVLAEVSRDNGISYEAIDKDVLTSLSLGQGGTSLRLRFMLAPGGALNHWGLIWR